MCVCERERVSNLEKSARQQEREGGECVCVCERVSKLERSAREREESVCV